MTQRSRVVLRAHVRQHLPVETLAVPEPRGTVAMLTAEESRSWQRTSMTGPKVSPTEHIDLHHDQLTSSTLRVWTLRLSRLRVDPVQRSRYAAHQEASKLKHIWQEDHELASSK